MGLYLDPVRALVEFYETLWALCGCRLGSCGVLWSHMEVYLAPICMHVEPYEAVWSSIWLLFGLLWRSMALYLAPV